MVRLAVLALHVLLPSLSVVALSPTVVHVGYSPICTSSLNDWVFDAPKTTTADTPNVSLSVNSPTMKGLRRYFNATGSLGLANHPLGVFKVNETNLRAEGKVVVELYDGVLGQLAFDFAAIEAGFAFDVQIDVWTVIPEGAAFFFDIVLWNHDSGSAPSDALLCMRIELSQPNDSGAIKADDVCEIKGPQAPVIEVPAIPHVIVDLDEPATSRSVTRTHTSFERRHWQEALLTHSAQIPPLLTRPNIRWDHVVRPRAGAINALLDAFIENLVKNATSVNGTLVGLLLAGVSELEMLKLPGDFAAEINGVAKAVGRNVGSIFILNLMYELTGLCTSFVAQSDTGTILHGRNLGEQPCNEQDPCLCTFRASLSRTHAFDPSSSSTRFWSFHGLRSQDKELEPHAAPSRRARQRRGPAWRRHAVQPHNVRGLRRCVEWWERTERIQYYGRYSVRLSPRRWHHRLVSWRAWGLPLLVLHDADGSRK